MDDKEKIAMLESDKVRLQAKINQQDKLLKKAIHIINLIQANNDDIMREWKKTIDYLRTNWLIGILTGVSLCVSLQGIIAILLI